MGLFLKASDCATLKTEVEALKAWKRSRKEAVPPIEIDCAKTPVLRELPVQSLLPSRAASIQGSYPACEGPNCWNSALHESGVLSEIRYIDGAEFTALLKSRCHLRDSFLGDPPQPGDVAAIRELQPDGRSWREIHGFIYIGQTAFSKNDMGKSSSWGLRPIEVEYSQYGYQGQPECLGPPLHRLPPGCRIFVSFYLCDRSFEVSDELGDLDPELKALARLHERVVSCVREGSGSPLTIRLTEWPGVSNFLNELGKKSPDLSPFAQSVGRQFVLVGAQFHEEEQACRASPKPPAEHSLVVQSRRGGHHADDEGSQSLESVIDLDDTEALDAYLKAHPEVNPAQALDGAVKKLKLRLTRWLLGHHTKPNLPASSSVEASIDAYLTHLEVPEGIYKSSFRQLIRKSAKH